MQGPAEQAERLPAEAERLPAEAERLPAEAERLPAQAVLAEVEEDSADRLNERRLRFQRATGIELDVKEPVLSTLEKNQRELVGKDLTNIWSSAGVSKPGKSPIDQRTLFLPESLSDADLRQALAMFPSAEALAEFDEESFPAAAAEVPAESDEEPAQGSIERDLNRLRAEFELETGVPVELTSFIKAKPQIVGLKRLMALAKQLNYEINPAIKKISQVIFFGESNHSIVDGGTAYLRVSKEFSDLEILTVLSSGQPQIDSEHLLDDLREEFRKKTGVPVERSVLVRPKPQIEGLRRLLALAKQLDYKLDPEIKRIYQVILFGRAHPSKIEDGEANIRTEENFSDAEILEILSP